MIDNNKNLSERSSLYLCEESKIGEVSPFLLCYTVSLVQP